MRTILLFLALIIGITSITKSQDMKDKTPILRLIYPQWQGGIVAHWMPDIPADDASRGYYLGAQLLNLLAPESNPKNRRSPDLAGHKRPGNRQRRQCPQGHPETNPSRPWKNCMKTTRIK